ncbi:tRNA (adenine(22)-N(1))-methyltransferase TrmK [Salinicoccus sp. YB14-2]|uniref:tRNA (adenine(22)-N(1))-methyltransferase n=1 Tax=Salinicoccus sp. YB14-2 TaxID=1572701 RepID=UPI00068A4A2D|nr:tRNA (adenine(22)-N(1))-methyltransferase TrmK [Salinicoccus sp. YB14-2]
MIDERLKYAANYIIGEKMVDIGSDHAYLPIYSIQNGIVNTAICGEVVEGPYHSTLKNIEVYHMSDKIEPRLGDGLKILSKEDKVDTITICGMGGPLIASIIEEGYDNVAGHPRLILQANNFTYPIRKTVVDLGYKITHEKVLKIGKRYYEIIVCDHDDEKIDLTEKELIFGPENLSVRDDEFISKVEWEHEHLVSIYNGINSEKSSGKKGEVKSKIKMLEEVLNDEN